MAYDLVHAVALLEGNVAPNEDGYNHDISLKSWGAEHVVTNAVAGVRTACEAVDNNPTLFGDRATTAGLINAVVDRLELHRPIVDGQPVGPEFWRKEA